SRGARSAPISQAPQASPASMPAVVRTRTDIGTPVLTVESQTDILAAGIGYLPATQPDSRWFRLWEVPGTSHVDETELGLSAAEGLRDIPFFPHGASRQRPAEGQD